jgi:hypothetical protein
MVSLEMVRDVLSYEPDTGLFFWKTGGRRGKQAGGKNSQGYIKIGVCGRIYSAHRLAFVFMGAPLPVSVDHINRDRADNRWENLRPSSPQAQQKNRSINANNTSGVSGVCFVKEVNKWQAQIKHKRRMIYLGSYPHFFDAVAARKSAERELNFSRD